MVEGREVESCTTGGTSGMMSDGMWAYPLVQGCQSRVTHRLQSVTTRHMPHILPAFPQRIKRTMQSTRTVTTREIAKVLHEPELHMIARALRVLGEERVIAILADALTIEHQGGMWLKDGSRKRSLGGIFLQLCRERSTPEERRKIFR